MSVRDRLECCLVRFMTGALTLDREVEGLVAEGSLVPELGDQHLAHPCNQYMATPISLLIRAWGWPVSCIVHGQSDAVAN